jgi:hypothetical protein
MAVWTVKGGVLKEVAASTVSGSDDASEAVKRGRGRPPKPRDAVEPATEAPADGDEI